MFPKKYLSTQNTSSKGHRVDVTSIRQPSDLVMFVWVII